MNKKVYLDENYRLDCEYNIGYIGYIIDGYLDNVMKNEKISAFEESSTPNYLYLHYYRKINDNYVKQSSQSED